MISVAQLIYLQHSENKDPPLREVGVWLHADTRFDPQFGEELMAINYSGVSSVFCVLSVSRPARVSGADLAFLVLCSISKIMLGHVYNG